jgi:hypothetical protein
VAPAQGGDGGRHRGVRHEGIRAYLPSGGAERGLRSHFLSSCIRPRCTSS